MMGHAFQRCDSKIELKMKVNWTKLCTFSDYLFFLSILEAGVSAFVAVRLGSISKNFKKKLFSIRYIYSRIYSYIV